ncbi:MAG: hypothetical protein ACQEP8_00355 [Chlamydiota bacterium]
MKITDTIISIPPYISTSWTNVQALHVEDTEESDQKVLVVMLKDGNKVEVPELDSLLIDEIFDKHALYLENQAEAEAESQHFNEEMQSKINNIFSSFPEGQATPDQLYKMGGAPLSFNIDDKEALEQMGAMMRHNPDQSDSPPLPQDVLDKIAAIAHIVTPEDLAGMPEPVEDCNCMHCQIMRAIRQEDQAEDHQISEEPVSDEDLKFREWDIDQINDKLYKVTNPLDPNEQYQVYLGDPIGCTCGKPHCEHLKAVLES